MKLDKKEETKIWDTMMERRRRFGPDPDDHPSIKRRMELEFVTIQIIINSILDKLSNTSPNTPSIAQSGWRNKAVILIVMISFMATLIMGTLTYREMSAMNSRVQDKMNKRYAIGTAILDNPNISCVIEEKELIITFSGEAKGGIGMPETYRIPHGMPPEQVEQLKAK